MNRFMLSVVGSCADDAPQTRFYVVMIIWHLPIYSGVYIYVSMPFSLVHSRTIQSISADLYMYLLCISHPPSWSSFAPPLATAADRLLNLSCPSPSCSQQSRGDSTQSLFSSIGGKKAAAAGKRSRGGRGRGRSVVRLPTKKQVLLLAVVMLAVAAKFGSAHAPSLTEVGWGVVTCTAAWNFVIPGCWWCW